MYNPHSDLPYKLQKERKMVIVDTKQLEKKIREIVKENPDARYKLDDGGCLYTYGGPDNYGCLVGRGLIACYPEMKSMLEEIDGYGGADFPDLPRFIDCSFDGSIDWVTYVQYRQDDGIAWERCIFLADDRENNSHIPTIKTGGLSE